VSCVLASQKQFLCEFFIPTRTDLGVKLLNRISGTTILLTLSGPAKAHSMQVEMSPRGHRNGS